MKTSLKLIASVVLSGMLFFQAEAQTNNRVSAYNALRDYMKLAQDNPTSARNKILEAKKYIDLAAEHPDTKEDPKTLFYKGQIYFFAVQYTAMKADGFKEFDAEKMGEEAFGAFKASIKLKNKKDDFTEQILGFITPIYNMSYNLGSASYGRGNFDTSQMAFESCVKLMDVVGRVDTTAAFNAGLCAENQVEPIMTKCLAAGDSICEAAKKHYLAAAENYKICVSAGYLGGDMYARYSEVLQKGGKIKEAKQAIEEGKAKYPKSNNLIIQEFNYYLMLGDNESAEKALTAAIQNNPRDPILQFNAGAIYSDLKRYDDAEKAYNKAIELDPKYFDAYFNLGAMYYNQAADLYKTIQDIKDNAVYEKEKNRADDLFKKAYPVLEKGRTINPKDRNNLTMLRTIYARLNMTDKWKEVNDILKNG